MMRSFYKRLPLINFAVGVSAFTFQLTVLYPWHNRLDNQFNNLKMILNMREK